MDKTELKMSAIFSSKCPTVVDGRCADGNGGGIEARLSDTTQHRRHIIQSGDVSFARVVEASGKEGEPPWWVVWIEKH